MGDDEEVKRLRSFAERYIIERASTFRVGHEKEDAWACIQDAKTVYGMVESSARAAVTASRANEIEKMERELAIGSHFHSKDTFMGKRVSEMTHEEIKEFEQWLVNPLQQQLTPLPRPSSPPLYT